MKHLRFLLLFFGIPAALWVLVEAMGWRWEILILIAVAFAYIMFELLPAINALRGVHKHYTVKNSRYGHDRNALEKHTKDNPTLR